MCVCCHPIYYGRQAYGRASRGYTGERSHRIYPPSLCGACLNFYGTGNAGRNIILIRYICIYVCRYGHNVWQSIDQLGKVANPARCQLKRENRYFPVSVRA